MGKIVYVLIYAKKRHLHCKLLFIKTHWLNDRNSRKESSEKERKMTSTKRTYRTLKKQIHTKHIPNRTGLHGIVHNLAHINIYVWLWIFMCNANKTKPNCAISIEHNLKMGVRPIFRYRIVIVIHFSPMLRHCRCFVFHVCVYIYSFFCSFVHFSSLLGYILSCILFLSHRMCIMLEHFISNSIWWCFFSSFFFPFYATFPWAFWYCAAFFMSYFMHNAHALIYIHVRQFGSVCLPSILFVILLTMAAASMLLLNVFQLRECVCSGVFFFISSQRNRYHMINTIE